MTVFFFPASAGKEKNINSANSASSVREKNKQGVHMKLKKSIEKAKQQRKQVQEKTEEQAVAEDKINAVVSGETASSPEWASPVFSESKTVELDLEKMAKNRLVSLFADAPEAEYYKVLRTTVQQRMEENGWNTIMISSVQPGEGKTLTCINLAVSFAKEFNQTVLLVDCDLKRQSIHRYLNISLDKGIADYLLNGCALKDMIIWPGIEKLTLISGGKTISNSVELLGSPKMKALVHEIKNRYDDRYIIFDTPPALGWADAIAFAPLVDCILMVVEEGRTSIKDVKKALELIPAEKFLGFVLNRRKVSGHKYYYY
jgi:protein-tyrosine kinase